jgi:hypothetical protein
MCIGAPDGSRPGTIDHPPGAHDDIPVAGVLVLVAGAGGAPLQSRSAWLLAKRRAEAMEASIGTADPSGLNVGRQTTQTDRPHVRWEWSNPTPCYHHSRLLQLINTDLVVETAKNEICFASPEFIPRGDD